MRKSRLARTCFAATLLGAFAACTTLPGSMELEAADPPSDGAPPDDPHGWPRSFQEEGLDFTVYQPQLEKWDGSRLDARSAVSIATATSPLPTFGTVWFTARTHVDKEERVASLEELTIARATFPSAADKTDAWLAVLRTHLPDQLKTMDLERLESGLATLEAERKAKSVRVQNEPPRIIFSPRPALLVLVDGAPVLRRVPGTTLDRVINTRALLLKDDAKARFYLGVVNRWLTSTSLEGPWTLTASPPAAADEARRTLVDTKTVDLHEEDAELTNLVNKGDVPAVFASTSPAELIETHGEPELEAIEGTSLHWVRNTDADVFVDSVDPLTHEWFVLVSGRWFRARSREGPWTFVPGKELPAEFARIPAAHPAGEVLASIPGTPQAQEAVIANEIPQTATVERHGAKIDVSYDGDPKFGPIAGTQLSYALNSDTPIVQSGALYYACDDGIWFRGESSLGPWEVAASVPAEIYSIPASCPIHYVTYVQVYDATTDVVYVGYTPGYFGTCVDDGCVVWGTGFLYHPWCGERWCGRPWTYGFGVGVRWSTSWGWNVGLGMGARPSSRPWWGPLERAHPAFYPVGVRSEHHLNLSNANIYRAWPEKAVRPHESHGAWFGSDRPRSLSRNNNVYSAPDGHVYRRGEAGWEHHENGSWHALAPTAESQRSHAQQLESERLQRERGADRSRNVWGQAASPVPHYQPMPTRHELAPQPSRPAPPPAPMPRGLRGTSVRGWSGGGFHGGGGHGGGHR